MDRWSYLIREAMRQAGVSTDFLHVTSQYTAAQSMVFVQEDGDRSIIMASGSTSMINGDVVLKYFKKSVMEKACMVTTEISQVPLLGVQAVLNIAKEGGIPSVLDLDVPPSVAVREAGLGSMDELLGCIQSCTVLKLAKPAGLECVSLMKPNIIVETLSLKDIASHLLELYGPRLLAITDGPRPSVLASNNCVVECDPYPIASVVDTTGAGDAFMGGLIAGFYKDGIPSSSTQMRTLGLFANRIAAVCCQALGGMPSPESRALVTDLLPIECDGLSSPVSSDFHMGEFMNSLSSDRDAISNLMEGIDLGTASRFVQILERCQGSILTSGIGKSAIVANRMAASLSSTGSSAHFVHASEWSHGDLGKVTPKDVAVFFSHSGNTEEITYAAGLVKRKGIPVLAIVGCPGSSLAAISDHVIDYTLGNQPEEPLGGAPTTSIVLQEVIVNGIMRELIVRKGFTKSLFLENHPGGSLGRRLAVGVDLSGNPGLEQGGS